MSTEPCAVPQPERDPAAAIGQLRTHFGEDRSRLLEATEHRQSVSAESLELLAPGRLLPLLIQPGEQLRDRGRAEQTSRAAPAEEELIRQARPPSMSNGPLESLHLRVHLRAHVRHPREGDVCDVQGEVIVGGLEHRQRLLDERSQLLGRALRLEMDAEDALLDLAEQLAHAIAASRGALDEGACALRGVVAPACREQGLAEDDLESEVELS